MAVIYLPEDKRAQILGQGLGALAGNIVSAWQDRQVNAGVQQIMQDQSIAQDQKIPTITAKYGKSGFDAILNQLKAKLITQQIAGAQGTQALTQAQTTGVIDKNALTEATMPEQIAAAKLKNQQTLAGIGLAGAETDRTKVQVPYIEAQTKGVGATTAETEARTETEKMRPGLVGAQSAKTGAEADQERIRTQLMDAQLDLYKSLSAGDEQSFQDRLSQIGITDATEQNRVRDALRTGGMEGYQKEVDKISSEHQQGKQAEKQAQIQRDRPIDLDSNNLNFTSNSAANAQASDRFLQAFLKEPATGLATGASIKAWMEGHGFSSGDPTFLNMYESQQQQIQKTATSGGGFFAQGRVALAHDVTANMSKSPLSNLIALDAVADQHIAELKNRLSGINTNKPRAPFDDALEKWQKVKDVTGTLQSYIDGGGKSVVIFQGNQVDPTNLKVLLPGNKFVPLKPGGDGNYGAQIIEAAKMYHMRPEEYIANRRAHFGYQGN